MSVIHKWCPRLTIGNYKQVKSSLTLYIYIYVWCSIILNLHTDSTLNFSFLICKYKGISCGEMGIIPHTNHVSIMYLVRRKWSPTTCHFVNIWQKPSPDFSLRGNKKMTKSNYLSFSEYLMKIKILWTCTPPLCV